MGDNSSSGSDDNVSHIVTVEEMLQTGLELFYTQARINRVKNNDTNIGRFNLKFGVKPATACMVYEDLLKEVFYARRTNNEQHRDKHVKIRIAFTPTTLV